MLTKESSLGLSLPSVIWGRACLARFLSIFCKKKTNAHLAPSKSKSNPSQILTNIILLMEQMEQEASVISNPVSTHSTR